MRHAPEWLIFRMGGFVGPNLRKNAIYDIMHGEPLRLDPQSALQFIHVDVAADIIMEQALSKRSYEIFNLCGAGVISISEVLSAVGSGAVCEPGSPAVRYEVNIEKLAGIRAIPESRQAVLEFIRGGEERQT